MLFIVRIAHFWLFSLVINLDVRSDDRVDVGCVETDVVGQWFCFRDRLARWLLRQRTTETHLMQDAAKLLPHQTVDDEVEGRVQGQQHISQRVDQLDDLLVVIVQATSVMKQFQQRYGDSKSKVRDFTDDERADDDHEHQGDVLAVLGCSTALLEGLPALTNDAQCRNETQVQDHEDRQRTNGPKDEEEDGFVDKIVVVVAAQLCVFGKRVGVFLTQAKDDLPFEEQRQVIENGSDDHHSDGHTGTIDAAQVGLEGLADGCKAIAGDENQHPDGGRLCYGSSRPNVDLHVGKGGLEGGQPVGQVTDCLHGLDEDAGDQVERVQDGERLQQPIRGVLLVVVTPQDNDRQPVAKETEEAEEADDEDVDEENAPIVDVKLVPRFYDNVIVAVVEVRVHFGDKLRHVASVLEWEPGQLHCSSSSSASGNVTENCKKSRLPLLYQRQHKPPI